MELVSFAGTEIYVNKPEFDQLDVGLVLMSTIFNS